MSGEITTLSERTTVFVTGATTSAGLALVRRLKRAGHTVVGTVESSSDARTLRTLGATPAFPSRYRAGELQSALTGTQAKIVVNLAPQAANQPPQIPSAWDTRTLEATEALVKAADAAGVQYLVHTSYAFADGTASDPEARTFLNDVRAGERAVLGSSFPAVVLRFGTVYGAESAGLQDVLRALMAGRPIHPGSNHRSDWLYADDAARAVEAALAQRPTGEVLTITDGTPASPKEFLRYFAGAQGLIAPENAPRFMLRNPYSRLQRALADLHVEAGGAAARSELDWKPQFPSYQHGIDDLLISWRAAEAV